jgi:hypothetical protein
MHTDIHDDHEWEALFASHFHALATIAISEFKIPNPDAEEIAHGVLISAICHLPRITDLPAWLHGAIVCAAEQYTSERG